MDIGIYIDVQLLGADLSGFVAKRRRRLQKSQPVSEGYEEIFPSYNNHK